MVKITSICGTNEDVNNILDKIYEIYEREIQNDSDRQIYIYQDFIDNSLVMQELNDLGIYVIYDLKQINSNDIVILSSYNEKDLDYLNNNHIEYYPVLKDNHNKSYLEDIEKSIEKEIKNASLLLVIGDGKDTHELTEKYQSIIPTYEFNDLNSFSTFFLKSDYTSFDNIVITGGPSTPLKEIYNYKYLTMFLLFYKDRLKEFKTYEPTFNQEFKSLEDAEEVNKIVDYFIDLNKDGKYLRGTLISLASLLAGYDNYLDLALTYETLETSILVHDDIIDNARTRRGKDTIPRRICKEYRPYSDNPIYFNDVLKLANSLAICTGDLFFYEAQNYLVKKYGTHPNFPDILKLYNDIVIKTIKGEVIDVTLPFYGKYDLKEIKNEDIINIYHLKTSTYTIIGPFALGYLLGGKKIDQKMEDILNKIGLSFQIKDDILGIFGDTQTIGKPNTSDICEFKQTLLYSYVINTSYKEEFLKIYGNKEVSNKDLLNIREILKESGALEYTYNYLNDLYTDITEGIDALDIKEDGKNILKGLIIYINIRSK